MSCGGYFCYVEVRLVAAGGLIARVIIDQHGTDFLGFGGIFGAVYGNEDKLGAYFYMQMLI